MKPFPDRFYSRCSIMLVLLSLLVYGKAIHLPFFSDDYAVMLRLSRGDFDTGIFLRPLGDFTLYLQYQLCGFNAAWYHLVNVLLHAGCAVLVLYVTRELLGYIGYQGPAGWVAALAALLYTCNPMIAETVIWIVGRGIILSTSCMLLSILFFLRTRAGKKWMRLPSLIFFALALSGYETALVLPALLFVMVLSGKGKLTKAMVAVLPFVAVVLAYLLLRVLLLPEFSGGGYFRTGHGPAFYAYNFAALLTRCFTPPAADSRNFSIMGAVVFVLLAAFFVLYRRRSPVSFPVLMIFTLLLILSLLPVVTVGISTRDYEGGRFLYQPAVFSSVLIALLLMGLLRSARGLMTGVSVMLAPCLALLLNVVMQWNTAGSLLDAAMRSLPVIERPFLLEGAPGKIGTAYFLRNGAREAVVIYGKTSVALMETTVPAGAAETFVYRDGRFEKKQVL
ncbi:MAG: hypothetical protein EOO09_03615 [Chitinophagaceae bacterium]|nr:MAG: hypothetical protein EOO09_03615 [Chitinophagaceae bacterium]